MNALPGKSSLSFQPLYKQVVGLLLRRLGSGAWKPGDVLPSEMDLAAELGVSSGTVRKAIDALVADNLLLRRQGKGTFVATHSDPAAFSRFFCLSLNEGSLSALRNVARACWRAKAGADVARALGLVTGAPIMLVRRELRSSSEPVVFDEIYLPGDLFGDLTLEMLRSADASLYGLFESRFGVRAIRAVERSRAVAADKVSAEALDVPEGVPLLLAERVTYTYDDRPVEWRRGFYSTRNYHYRVELG